VVYIGRWEFRGKLVEGLDINDPVCGYFAQRDKRELRIEYLADSQELSDEVDEEDMSDEEWDRKQATPGSYPVYVNFKGDSFWADFERDMPMKIWVATTIGSYAPKDWKIGGWDWVIDVSDEETFKKLCHDFYAGMAGRDERILTVWICRNQAEFEGYQKEIRNGGPQQDHLQADQPDPSEAIGATLGQTTLLDCRTPKEGGDQEVSLSDVGPREVHSNLGGSGKQCVRDDLLSAGLEPAASRMVQERVPVEAETEETAVGVLGMLGWQMEKTLSEMVKNGFRPQPPK
jgi:hypothetical protein